MDPAIKAELDKLKLEINELQDRAAIQALFNRYVSLHDDSCKRNDPEVRSSIAKWEALWVEDASITYPFGSKEGREGLGEWTFK